MNKIMIKALLLTAISMFTSASAFAEERIVLSFYENKDELMKTQSNKPFTKEQCFTLSEKREWCVPVPQSYQGNGVYSFSSKGKALKSVTVKKPDELSFSQAKNLLESTKIYLHIEKDVKIKSNSSWNSVVPNDELFSQQNQFLTNNSNNKTSSSVLDMWSLVKNPTKNISVYVLDSGFREDNDITFADGFNFTVVEYDTERGVGFLEGDYNDETCTDQHGLITSSIIGAEINNANKISGMVGNVTITPVRVMDCGRGFLSDVAATLSWLSGESITNVPDFKGDVGVVNMSLGGFVGDSCPFYLKNAIEKATAAGFVLVSSAGNENADAGNYAPGNCAGVINVGAMNDPKFNNLTVDKADFSNYGKSVDITAMGINVFGLNSFYGAGGWAGTSFSAPIVTSLIALAQKDFSLTPSEWENLVSISGLKVWEADSQCDLLGCGNGVLDGVKLYKNVEKYINGELNTMDFSLNLLSTCNQLFVIKHLSTKEKACDKITVNLNGFNEDSGTTFKLYTVDSNLTMSPENLVLLTESEKTVFNLSKTDISDKQIYVQSCASENCSDLFVVNSDKLKSIPSVCL